MIAGIADRRTFARLRQDGFTVRARDLRARHLPATSAPGSIRVAYAIPRRVGNAVARNRIRRRIRGVLDERVAVGRALPSGATLFVVNRPCTALDSTELRQQVDDVITAIQAHPVRA